MPNSLVFLGELLSERERGFSIDRSGLNGLFDGIVFSRKYRWLGFLRKYILLEILPTRGFIEFLLQPSFIAIVLGLGLVFLSGALESSWQGMLALPGSVIILGGSSLGLWSVISTKTQQRIELFAMVMIHRAIRTEEIKDIFGLLVSRRLSKLQGRLVGRAQFIQD